MGRELQDTVRIGIKIHRNLYEYYKKKSRETGIPQGYLMAMDLMEKAKQDDFVLQFPELMKQVERVQKGEA